MQQLPRPNPPRTVGRFGVDVPSTFAEKQPTKSMDRGFHDTLIKHGYTYHGASRPADGGYGHVYRHPKTTHMAFYEPATKTLYHHSPDGSRTLHQDSSKFHDHLTKLHEGGAKHSAGEPVATFADSGCPHAHKNLHAGLTKLGLVYHGQMSGHHVYKDGQHTVRVHPTEGLSGIDGPKTQTRKKIEELPLRG